MVKALWRKWTKLVRRVTDFIGRVMLLLVYFTVVAFIALVVKLFPAKISTGWVDRQGTSDFERQS